MGFLSFLLSSKPKSAKKCVSCGKERLPGVKIPGCLLCSDGVCAECSRDGICSRCRHQQECESRMDQSVADTQEFYASKDQSKPASCGRCSSKHSDLLSCMSCEKLCCSSCADEAFVSPFRRCRLCPSPVGGELAFVAKLFEKQNQMQREKELSDKRAATLRQLDQCAVPTDPSVSPASWIGEVSQNNPAAVRSVTPYHGRLPIEEECSVCRVLVPPSLKEADMHTGYCMQCCRTICEYCSYDSSNCVLGQLLCEKCKGRVYHPKDVDRASQFCCAVDPGLAHSGLDMAIGSTAAALVAVRAFSNSMNSRVLLPPLMPSDTKVSSIFGAAEPTLSNVNAKGQKAVLAAGTFGASMSIAASVSVEYSRFNSCPFAADIASSDAAHEVLLSYGREGFETEALLITIAREPALYLALSSADASKSNEKPTKKKAEKVDKKKLEKKHRRDVDAFEGHFIRECEVLAKKALQDKLSMLRRLQILNHSGLVKVRNVQEQSDDSHWRQVSSLLGVERDDISVVCNYLNQVSNVKDRSSLPSVASATVSIQSALGEAADLKQFIETQREPFSEAVIVSLSLQIAEALQYLHTGGMGSESTFKAYAANGGITKESVRPLIHGAVTPKNIMLCESNRVVLMYPSTMWSTVPPAHRVAATTQSLHSLVQLLLSKVAPEGVVDTTLAKELSDKLNGGNAAPFILEMLDEMNATRRDGPSVEAKETLSQQTASTTEYLEKLRLTTMTRREKIALRAGSSAATTTQKLADFVVRGSKIVKCDPFNPNTWMESSDESSQEDSISDSDDASVDKEVGDPATPSNDSSFNSTADAKEIRGRYLATNPYRKYDDSDSDGSYVSASDEKDGGSDDEGKGAGADHVPQEISIPEVKIPQQDHVPGYYSEAPEEVPIEYIAPEMRTGRGCPKSDVWSLGVVMLVLAALPEFPLLGIEGRLVDIGCSMWTKDRLASAIDSTILENCHSYSSILLTLITQMLQPIVDDRPSSSDVVRVLRGMATSLDLNRVD